MDDTNKNDTNRVRKRAPNACTRCRRQKIKCSGDVPCQQCSRRSLHCVFDDKQQKVFVSQSYIAELERRVATSSRTHEDHSSGVVNGVTEGPGLPPSSPRASSANDLDAEHRSESENANSDALLMTPEPGMTNPLDPSNSDSFTVNTASKRFFLGVSSNWSFGRRVLRMIYERLEGVPLPATSLLFEGSTYDLGWDGHRSSAEVDISSLPTADFALFLINAVKFHVGRLFHLFDEAVFMHSFARFYEDPGNEKNYSRTWYVHFLLVLAFGKAFIVRANRGKRPPGADLFVQAMKLLPDITALYDDPLQSVEVLCCAALYLQCLDLRSAGYTVIGQAMRIAVEQGMHTDMQSHHLSDSVVERCRETWWTVYVLDRQMTSLMGVPMGFSDDDITALLPSFSGSARSRLALSLHVKLAKSQAVILQTVYGKSGGRSARFLLSMKDALRTIAEANDERNESFPLDLKNPSSGICRLSAYLHLFHHQCLILATRPLLYSFLQKRLDALRPLHVSSSHGARSLLRVCVGSAQQCLSILEVLQSQSLLESFIPFDREATFSSAVVLVVAAVVDPSIARDTGPRVQSAIGILDEMAFRGNLIAEFHKKELEQLSANIARLEAISEHRPSSQTVTPTSISVPGMPSGHSEGFTSEPNQSNFDNIDTLLSEWNSEDGLNGDHLLAVANSLDFSQLNWLATGDFEQSLGAEYRPDEMLQ